MGAFTGSPVSTTLYAGQIGSSGVLPHASQADAVLRAAFFTYTHAAGAGTGEINLFKLPAGLIRVVSTLSALITSAFAATADGHVGYRAHNEPDGDAVVADDNAFLDNADVATGGLFVWDLPTARSLALPNRDGIVLALMIDTANIEDTDTVNGWVTWAQGN